MLLNPIEYTMKIFLNCSFGNRDLSPCSESNPGLIIKSGLSFEQAIAIVIAVMKTARRVSIYLGFNFITCKGSDFLLICYLCTI